MTLLNVDRLTISRASGAGEPLVREASFTVERGEVVGVVGESGSGKTLTGLSLLGLLPHGLRASGSIVFDGRELLAQTEKQWQRTRGADIAMVLQDPSSSLHPMLKLGEQLTDHVRLHLGLGRAAAQAKARELLERVHLREPDRLLGQYPHQLSGGMKQRVSIAIALACDPKLLIADEPTTALDANIRTGIIALLDELRRESGMGIIFVTHDLAMLSSIADRLNVFRTGEIVEAGEAESVFRSPQHPYTRVLLDAVPQVPWPLPKEVQS
ncbi:ABC transporter ATP-binding protein [Leucobacter allii]|uniref:ABC transporter ATP-binding protein n=1 Tax=Leucobacter allii TaxID=2932247 RepID=A0ABY4FK36_9MICO|nr:ABC transporter ATP-binding protein [Leucobacter allii]UOQ56701.1 ABC transporter ATP-binding protein [Leucobacter allii]UOR01134.1 ABC transporter ATP-binding protein [Leucobacter allii]